MFRLTVYSTFFLFFSLTSFNCISDCHRMILRFQDRPHKVIIKVLCSPWWFCIQISLNTETVLIDVSRCDCITSCEYRTIYPMKLWLHIETVEMRSWINYRICCRRFFLCALCFSQYLRKDIAHQSLTYLNNLWKWRFSIVLLFSEYLKMCIVISHNYVILSSSYVRRTIVFLHVWKCIDVSCYQDDRNNLHVSWECLPRVRIESIMTWTFSNVIQDFSFSLIRPSKDMIIDRIDDLKSKYYGSILWYECKKIFRFSLTKKAESNSTRLRSSNWRYLNCTYLTVWSWFDDWVLKIFFPNSFPSSPEAHIISQIRHN